MANSGTDLDGMLAAAPPCPRRIVCMTEETTETLYRIGAGDLVVGVSGFTVRPPEARKKPRVSSFLDARFDEILDLRPDLVLGFSDLQADLAAELARRGVPVWLFNQRSVAEILQMVRTLAAVVGLPAEGEALAGELTEHLRTVAAAGDALPRRPRVFFEEWHDPLIGGIRWVSELVEVAGGEEIFPELREEHGAKGRILDPEAVAERDPEVIIASWCGRKARPDHIAGRPGFADTAAVRNDQVNEIKSAYILQPGPAALTDGLDQLHAIIAAAARGEHMPRRREGDCRQALHLLEATWPGPDDDGGEGEE